MDENTAKIVVFGIGDFANQVTFYLKNDSKYEIVAYVVDAEYNKKKTFLGLPIVNFEDVENIYPPYQYSMFVAIGYNKLNTSRELKFQQAKSKGYTLISYVCSRNSFWNDLQIGENCFIMEGNIIMQNVKIGDNVILAINNKIGHDTIIENNCFLASNVMIGGFCVIKQNTFIGLNTVIKDKTIIAEYNILGAAAIILKNTKPHCSYLTKSTPLTPDPNNIIQDLI